MSPEPRLGELWGILFLFLYNRPNFSHSSQVFSYCVVATLHSLFNEEHECNTWNCVTAFVDKTVHSEAVLELLIVSHDLPQQMELSWKCRFKDLKPFLTWWVPSDHWVFHQIDRINFIDRQKRNKSWSTYFFPTKRSTAHHSLHQQMVFAELGDMMTT